jgi:hypothetical protein
MVDQFYVLAVASHCVAGFGEKSRTSSAVSYAGKHKSGLYISILRLANNVIFSYTWVLNHRSEPRSGRKGKETEDLEERVASFTMTISLLCMGS